MTPGERTDRLIGRIAREHGVTVAMIKGSRGSRETIRARFEVYSLLSRQGWSSVKIGKHLGGRDHSTVLEGLQRLQVKRTAEERKRAEAGDPLQGEVA